LVNKRCILYRGLMTGGGGQTSYICFNAGGRSADDDGVTSSDLAVLTQSPRDKYLLRDCGGRGAHWSPGRQQVRRPPPDSVDVVNGQSSSGQWTRSTENPSVGGGPCHVISRHRGVRSVHGRIHRRRHDRGKKVARTRLPSVGFRS